MADRTLCPDCGALAFMDDHECIPSRSIFDWSAPRGGTTTPTGWLCPSCDLIHAPQVLSCHCRRAAEVRP